MCFDWLILGIKAKRTERPAQPTAKAKHETALCGNCF